MLKLHYIYITVVLICYCGLHKTTSNFCTSQSNSPIDRNIWNRTYTHYSHGSEPLRTNEYEFYLNKDLKVLVGEAKYVVGRQNYVDRHLVDRLLSKKFRRHDTSSTQHFVDKHFVEIFSSTRHFLDKHFVDTTLRRNFFVDTNMQKSKSC
jgi:hypothetical protein